MLNPPDGSDKNLSPDAVAKATSELNNLLQIIAGTSSALEAAKNTGGAEQYLEILRTSIDRAEKVAAELARQAGGAADKRILQPEIGPLLRTNHPANLTTTTHTILLVDDEEAARGLMEQTLLEAGFHVVAAQSAFQCLDLFRCYPHRFALVLLDLTLPFIDGEETFHRLRQIRNDIPIVLCTGFILEDRLKEMMAAGLTGFLRKPIAPEELVSVVRSSLVDVKYLSDKATSRDVRFAI